MEDKSIQLLLPAYNISPSAHNTLGLIHTDDTKQKMRTNYSSERREAIGALNRGKVLYLEEREHLSKKALARSPMSETIRQKISAH